MANISDAIYDGFDVKLLGTTNTFKTAIGSRLYRVKAVDSATFPYVVMRTMPIEPSRDSMNKYFDTTITFLIASSSLAEIQTIAGYLYDQLEDSEASLSFTGYRTIRIDRVLLMPEDYIEGVFNLTDQYKLMLQKN
jgi:hypothetical protein